MKVKFIYANALCDLEDQVNEFCEHERVIDVSLTSGSHVWAATIKYQPVVHCNDHVFDKNTNSYQQ